MTNDKNIHFEVSIYNQQVRDYIEKGKNHPNYGPEWANLRFLEYQGNNEQDIIKQVYKKYPERKGFIITKIIKLKYV